MPTEILDADAFMKLAEKAEVCRVLRSGDEAKLKLRTPRRLYTMRIESAKVDELLKNLKCKVVELTKDKKRQKEAAPPTPREKREEE